MKAYLFFALAVLISPSSYAQEKLEFETAGTSTICYQPLEDAYQQAIAELQASADRICYLAPAIRVTKIVTVKSNYCLVRVKAGFVCP
ncbi:hypothetical protein D3C87_1591410 [compost metagenome]